MLVICLSLYIFSFMYVFIFVNFQYTMVHCFKLVSMHLFFGSVCTVICPCLPNSKARQQFHLCYFCQFVDIFCPGLDLSDSIFLTVFCTIEKGLILCTSSSISTIFITVSTLKINSEMARSLINDSAGFRFRVFTRRVW